MTALRENEKVIVTDEWPQGAQIQAFLGLDRCTAPLNFDRSFFTI